MNNLILHSGLIARTNANVLSPYPLLWTNHTCHHFGTQRPYHVRISLIIVRHHLVTSLNPSVVYPGLSSTQKGRCYCFKQFYAISILISCLAHSQIYSNKPYYKSFILRNYDFYHVYGTDTCISQWIVLTYHPLKAIYLCAYRFYQILVGESSFSRTGKQL